MTCHIFSYNPFLVRSLIVESPLAGGPQSRIKTGNGVMRYMISHHLGGAFWGFQIVDHTHCHGGVSEPVLQVLVSGCFPRETVFEDLLRVAVKGASPDQKEHTYEIHMHSD